MINRCEIRAQEVRSNIHCERQYQKSGDGERVDRLPIELGHLYITSRVRLIWSLSIRARCHRQIGLAPRRMQSVKAVIFGRCLMYRRTSTERPDCLRAVAAYGRTLGVFFSVERLLSSRLIHLHRSLAFYSDHPLEGGSRTPVRMLSSLPSHPEVASWLIRAIEVVLDWARSLVTHPSNPITLPGTALFPTALPLTMRGAADRVLSTRPRASRFRAALSGGALFAQVSKHQSLLSGNSPTSIPATAFNSFTGYNLSICIRYHVTFSPHQPLVPTKPTK